MWIRKEKRAAPETGRACLILLGGMLVLVIIMATGMGYMRISAGDVIRIIFYGLSGNHGLIAGINKVFPYVVWDVRLPRVLTAAVVGTGLSLAGVVFQGILLNPLADPYTLGISAGAAFGASIALLLDIGSLGIYSVSFIKYVADEQVSIIIFWLMGSFGSKTWVDVFITFSFVFIGFIICIFFARDLNIMSLGDRSASSLGINPNRTRITLLVTASMITAVCVSVSGIIGFVGLIIPHLMRFMVGSDSRRLVPASALAGAILLLSADTVTRALLPAEIPIGVLTALIGGPFFCYIFKKRQTAVQSG
ncbi:MAG: iron ABC transporter permease [Deltaproteobacteria bacterium]|nr:iron ABC transporter permease [Deltaproteobacteria bacterium]